MSVPADWYRWIPEQITTEEYAALPEEFCRSIEVIDGHIVKCESPSRVHNRVAFNLTQIEGRLRPDVAWPVVKLGL